MAQFTLARLALSIRKAVDTGATALPDGDNHWMVRSLTKHGVIYELSLKEDRITCTCPANGPCVHIGAVCLAQPSILTVIVFAEMSAQQEVA